MSNFLREARVSVFFLDLRIFVTDLFGSLVFLIQKLQVIGRHKIIEDICADKVGRRQFDLVKNLWRGLLQDLICQ